MRELLIADAFAVLPTGAWFLIFRGTVVYYRRRAAYDPSGVWSEWDFWVYFPLGMSLSLLVAALTFNYAVRRADLLTLTAGASLLATIPWAWILSIGVVANGL